MSKVLKILIADDNNDYVNFLVNIFEKDERLKVVGIAKSDIEELKLIEYKKPQLVISDIRKAEKYTGIKIIEKFINKKDSPIFFIISGSTTDFIKELIELKIRYYLSKPIEIKKLLDKINEIYEEVFQK